LTDGKGIEGTNTTGGIELKRQFSMTQKPSVAFCNGMQGFFSSMNYVITTMIQLEIFISTF
jgi:hypothetical protein